MVGIRSALCLDCLGARVCAFVRVCARAPVCTSVIRVTVRLFDGVCLNLSCLCLSHMSRPTGAIHQRARARLELVPSRQDRVRYAATPACSCRTCNGIGGGGRRRRKRTQRPGGGRGIGAGGRGGGAEGLEQALLRAGGWSRHFPGKGRIGGWECGAREAQAQWWISW